MFTTYMVLKQSCFNIDFIIISILYILLVLFNIMVIKMFMKMFAFIGIACVWVPTLQYTINFYLNETILIKF